MSEQFRPNPGDAVQVQDASGKWHAATAVSHLDQGHKFPIVWVRLLGHDGHTEYRMPWPVEYVRPPGGSVPELRADTDWQIPRASGSG